jgi:hypothetical protein
MPGLALYFSIARASIRVSFGECYEIVRPEAVCKDTKTAVSTLAMSGFIAAFLVSCLFGGKVEQGILKFVADVIALTVGEGQLPAGRYFRSITRRPFPSSRAFPVQNSRRTPFLIKAFGDPISTCQLHDCSCWRLFGFKK